MDVQVTLLIDEGAGLAEPVPLPEPRGSLTEQLLHRFRRPAHDLGTLLDADDDPVLGEDAPLALHLCYEHHYRGLPDVDEFWEWEPSLLALRARLERRFEARVAELAGPTPIGLSGDDVRAALRTLATSDTGPALSAFVSTEATVEQVRELAVHRSPYQLKEADPHTWGIPRLTGRAKAAMVEIQKEEYGDGRVGDVHATLFATTMAALGLDPTYGRYLDHVPGVTLSTGNLISLFGLHRRWRGALVGHLALFEMCSVGPMGRYATGLRRLGFGRAATRFYDEHVIADEHHQVVALDEMVAGLVADEPFIGGEIVFGAVALQSLEAAFATHVMDAWTAGRSSLRMPLDRP